MNGTQYTSLVFGEGCQVLRVRPFRGTVGDSYDNSLRECFLAILEWERPDRRIFHSIQ